MFFFSLFQVMLFNEQVPKKEHFQRFLADQPPLPDGYSWKDLKDKFKVKIQNNRKKKVL